MRWDMARANEHAAARRVTSDAGYSSWRQWLVSRMPRFDWTWR